MPTSDQPLPSYNHEHEISQVLAKFESCTLPRPMWTHRAHLTIALWYLRNHPMPEATRLIRQGILNLNDSLGIISDRDSGYHETITLFFVGLIRHHLDQLSQSDSLLAATNSLLAKYGQKDLPLHYWSKELLMSRQARAQWVNPDLRPLDWCSAP
jgi:hypothetical protein